MGIKFYQKCLPARRSFGTLKTLLNSSFNIYTNNSVVSSNEFFSEVYLMNKKLMYYMYDYFRLNDWSYKQKKKIGCLFPACYSQLVFKFCVLLNNFDYISIPTPIKKAKQMKQKYSFYIAENNIDLILCHPFYKHYIEEISFNLQIPFLICYDKPDILSHEEYVEDLNEGRENFAKKFMHGQKKCEDYINGKKNALNQINSIHFDNHSLENNNDYFVEDKDGFFGNREGLNIRKNNVSFHLQLSKENECDKSIKFSLSNILKQSKIFTNFMQINGKEDNVLVCSPANNIQYFDILFNLIYTGATIVFPEISVNKVLNNNSYMEWFKNHMKNKNNNFSVHNLIIKNDFVDDTFDFIDGSSLFEEILNMEKGISTIVCNNYLIRDFILFFENCPINNVTKEEFIQKKANKVRSILINGNEIMPGIHKKYVEKIKKIFINAKIFQRYVVQEIGTICVMELGKLEEELIPYERKIAGYVLPNINIEIDTKTNILKIKSENIFTEYYNNSKLTSTSFDKSGFFKTKYIASITENSLLKIDGIYNGTENLPDEYYLYFKQRRDKMEKHPPGYLKRVRLHGQIWGNFHADKRNWKRKF
ncbi:AMP-binding protein [Plasmodium brasilianum]|uniref:AMP-dependent synthetase/ligase domain-containing protein n=2 Tax=Plasmodium (Plasmodium) TaxID=418103 RepID=A0A1A8VXC1_PLAMA|nr:conserved Plasmodium protein, unknown function [Plasmodium malariae]KAI4838787.1 AMP-binding protein [Plasmodium brasilianum]SBS84355.1 conserved Plasmodium protein, unknown function [Plasmodium malariae]SCN12127.1 conserved Plasmodium protein, unknown function [Plasmodium malariae]